METPEHTAMAYLVTDEEVGSNWNVGVSSEWFRMVVSEMIRAEKGAVTELDIMTCFSYTDMITADTTTATNPIWPEPQAKGNASMMHHGLVIKLYGPGRNANSEFVARLRNLLDGANVPWQTHSYKAGYGGGTISRYFSAMNMEVTDWGIGIWSMHAPLEVASKADLWSLWKGFIAFFQS
jgi:aspartyl aminopeptidase